MFLLKYLNLSSLSGSIHPLLAFSKIFIALLTFLSSISSAKVNASLVLFVVALSLFVFCLELESAKSGADVLECLACLFPYVITCLARLLACVFTCLRARVVGVLCLRACYDVCLACLALAHSRFCLIIYFVWINQGFAIKRKLLTHVNLS